MNKENDILERICSLLGPFNKEGIALNRDTNIATDLELDSLAVMDLLAAIEDEFDISVPLNILPDLETIGQMADAVEAIVQEKN
ncbi:MAG TPA: acyl carrier protein [Alphaproteobacteria bacterium]|nr:acyl carrier protein [Alphaproteobacteria bacterium]